LDVILVQPKNILSRAPYESTTLSLGLLSVATSTERAGYTVKILDQRIEPDWEASLLAELKTKPLCVGITSMTGPALEFAVKTSRLVKDNSSVPVIWGGVHASLLSEQTLRNPWVDIVVQGEGEETFPELVRSLGNGQPLSNIKGIMYRENGEIKQNPPRPLVDLNKQPPLSYHLVDLNKNMIKIRGIPALPIETSRGCPFNCAFCYNTSFRHKKWRALDSDQTLSQMTRAMMDYRVRSFYFSDDNFFVDLDRVQAILEGIINIEQDISWGKGDIRLDLLSKLDDDFLRLIERSGCLSLIIGLESGSQRIADFIRKEIDISAAISVNRRLAKYNMWPRYLFLIGIPGETNEDLKKTADLMLKLVNDNPKATLGVQIFIPYPGTELFEVAVQHGFQSPKELVEWARFTWTNRRLEYPWLAPDAKKCIQMISFCSYFLAKGNTEVFAGVSPLLSLLTKLYYPVAQKRIKDFNYRFFPEFKLAELVGFKGY
jgi:radical SAM superfamily enzyme YgiQ (UPF0313 family)